MNNPFQWLTIYSAADAVEANIVKGLLLANDVNCQLLGESLQSAVG
ncbi:MAG: putative signal transducing protein, partial [Pseudoalteromonas sp.]